MKIPLSMKSAICRLLLATALPVVMQTASAQVLLTDEFTVDANSNDPNFELGNGRQSGPQALSDYRSNGGQHQVGNPGTFVGQPGGATNSNYLLLAFGGGVQNKTDVASAATGPLVVSFDMYFHSGGNTHGGDPTDWGSFCLNDNNNNGFPVVGSSGEFGFLTRYNGGIQVFQNGGSITPNGWDTPGFALADHWVFTFTDTAGTGSAFVGNGSQVTIVNGTTTLGTITLSQLNSFQLYPSFDQNANMFVGVDHFSVAVVPPTVTTNLSFEQNVVAAGSASTVVPAGWTGFNKSNGDNIGSQDAGGVDYTTYSPLAAPADGNQYCFINMFNPSVTGGIYQDLGPLQPNTIYTLTVAIGSRADRINSPGIISLVNGTNNTGTVLATAGGLPATQDTWQDYTTTYATGASVSGDLTVMLSVLGNGTTIQADFDNVRLSSQKSVVPLPARIQDTTPGSATVAVGSSPTFTAAFSNLPPVSLQWQQIANGVTNNLSNGVVNVTSNGVVTSTLTLNNVQLAAAGSYRLQAVNATNSAGLVYTTPAALTVVPTITWYTPGSYNSTFVDNTVLGYAGTVANEVYGVDFGGSGAQTTANGYSFNDFSDGNFSIANSGALNGVGGLENGASTGDGSFDAVLDSGVYGSGANIGTLNNLTVGQTYTVLVLQDDSRTSAASGPKFDVTDGLTTSPSQTYAFRNGTPAIGGFIIGTFTARATTQPLTVLNNGNAQYIAVLLEAGIAPAPPIPPSLATDVQSLQEVATGQAVTLSVSASGALPLKYQWSNQNGPISGATNATYTFPAIAGTNSYFAGITNAYGGIASSTAVVISSTNIVTVNNFSFENGTTGSGNAVIPVAWNSFNNNNFSTVSGSSYSVVNPLAPPAQGNEFFAINEGPSDPTGGIYQDVGPLLPNTTYTLTVAIGRRVDFPNPPGSLGSPGIISLINGTNNTGIVLATTNGIPATADSWQDYTVSYITGASVSGDLVVELSVAGASTYQANFDNVQLTKAPAPLVIPPYFTTNITALRSEVTTGKPVTLSVAAAGGSPLRYQWSNQNGPIAGATSPSYTFNAVNGTSSYFVTVSNPASAIVSATAVVISAPDLVTVNNFSFENGTTGSGTIVIPVAWSTFNNNNFSTVSAASYNTIDPLAPPADGNDFFAINEGPNDPTGGIYQDVGPLLPYTTYTLTVATGCRADFTPGNLGSPGIITLLNGTSNLGTVLATTNGIPNTSDTWQDYTTTYTTGASVSGDLTIELSVAGASTYQANFDNVILTAVTAFHLGAPTISGGKLNLTGAGGTPGAGYSLLTTTNLAAAGSWTVSSTGTLDANGAFSISIPINNQTPAEFFRVSMP